jgi:hypothetical protein
MHADDHYQNHDRYAQEHADDASRRRIERKQKLRGDGIDLVEKNPDHKIKAEQHDGDAQQMQRATSGPGSFRCRRVAKRSIIASSRFQTRLLMASGGHRRARRE